MRFRRWLKGSAYTERLPKGCVHCARGGKLVLLVTGKCLAGCYYCPLSPEKRGKRLIFANELRVKHEEDILLEAELIGATGTGITGGDPLIRPSQAARHIALLKDRFGDRHHIHLYTSSANTRSISTVARAGLDEIRFHPPVLLWDHLEKSAFRSAISRSLEEGMETGIEIPSLPGHREKMIRLLDAARVLNIHFVNINELEFSEANWRALRSRGFEVRSEISSAVRGSERLAISLLTQSPSGLPVHYCSSSFKDTIQLRRRIMRRARRIRRPLDILTEDGTFLMGIIENPRPERLAEAIRSEYRIPLRLIAVNREMRRVEIAPWVLDEIASDLNHDAFIIEEYPTADRLEVERERVSIRRR